MCCLCRCNSTLLSLWVCTFLQNRVRPSIVPTPTHLRTNWMRHHLIHIREVTISEEWTTILNAVRENHPLFSTSLMKLTLFNLIGMNKKNSNLNSLVLIIASWHTVTILIRSKFEIFRHNYDTKKSRMMKFHHILLISSQTCTQICFKLWKVEK